MNKLTITVHGPTPEEDRVFILSDATSRDAVQREAECSYLLALVRGHQQRARQLADLASEGWAREVRQDEKRVGG